MSGNAWAGTPWVESLRAGGGANARSPSHG